MKTVHAKYCSKFVHAPWKDGSLVHVNITKEKFKWYSEKIHTALARIQRRSVSSQRGTSDAAPLGMQTCLISS